MPTHDRRSASITLVCVALCLLSACASTSPNYEARFGDAVRSTRQAQVINPQAGENAQPVLGLDGPASREAVQRYHNSFKTPPPVVNVINVGGAR